MKPMTGAMKNQRNGLIAKIKIQQKSMNLGDDRYRGLLYAVTNKSSCKDMDIEELSRVSKYMQSLNKQSTYRPKRSGKRVMDQAAQSRKMRALWLNLYHIAEIEDSSEEALCSYARRMVGVEHLGWLTSDQANRVINGLRGWLKRVGYRYPESAIRRLYPSDGLAENVAVLFLIAHKLEINLIQWMEENGYGSYESSTKIEAADVMRMIETLGKELRERKHA